MNLEVDFTVWYSVCLYKINSINFLIYCYVYIYSNDCINEKTKLKKWGLLSFSKKPKSTINLQKGVEGASLSEDGINQVKQLIEYLSKEQSK